MRLALLRAALSICLLLGACGGGGGGGDSGGGGNSGPSASVLSGVVSVGAPVGGATVTVVDAKGTAMGTATSSAADGSYRLTLSGTSPSLPLFIQARGLDANGLPVLLHSLVPVVGATQTAHITPLTQAQAALALGGDPRAAFAAPADAGLGTASGLLTGASDFLKVLLKTALTDVKIADASKLDLLADSGFATAKSSADLLLESTRIGLDGSGLKLQLSSKFLVTGATEVELTLATARTELAKGSSGTPASAITSTAQVTSAAATVLANAGTLDAIISTLNPLLAQSSTTAAAYKASTALSGYVRHNGRSADDLANALVDWSSKGLQLGSLQILGCVDETVKKGDCLKVLVGSTLSDRSGKPVDRLIDVASYSSTAKRWSLVGNGKTLSFEVHPASWLRLDGSGKAEAAGSTGNPGIGVEIDLQQSNASGDSLDTATLQTPLGFALPMAACAPRPLMCVAKVGDTEVVPTAGLNDQFLQQGQLGWLGGADGLRGALYKISYTRGSTLENRTAYLGAAMLANPSAARHPQLDGVATTPLTVAGLRAGLKIDWTTWAAANPDLRLTAMRAVVRYADRVSVRELDPTGVTKIDVPPTGAVGGLTAVGLDIWMIAVDASGRRWATRYTLLS